MRFVADDVRNTWDSNDVTALVFAIHVVLNAAGGAILIAGGDDGITAPSLASVRDSIGHLGWGAGLCAAAAALVAAAAIGARYVLLVMAAIAISHLLIGAGVFAAVLAAPPGPPYPAPYGVDIFLYPAALTAASAVPYWRRRGRSRPRED